MRAHHQAVLRREAYFPKPIAGLKDVEVHVTNWETDIGLFLEATGEIFPEQLKKMMLIDLCPDALNKHLRAREHLKVEI
jgi:hypothetical protein